MYKFITIVTFSGFTPGSSCGLQATEMQSHAQKAQTVPSGHTFSYIKNNTHHAIRTEETGPAIMGTQPCQQCGEHVAKKKKKAKVKNKLKKEKDCTPCQPVSLLCVAQGPLSKYLSVFTKTDIKATTAFTGQSDGSDIPTAKQSSCLQGGGKEKNSDNKSLQSGRNAQSH